LIDGRQDSRHTQAYRTDKGVSLSFGIASATAAEHLTLGKQLGMHLQPDDGLKVHSPC